MRYSASTSAAGARRPQRSRAALRRVFAGVGAVSLLVLTACTSADTGGGPSNGATGTDPADVALAAAVAEHMKPPTVTVSEPLKSAVPKGKTIVYLQCEFEQCNTTKEGIEAAATAIGWNLRTIAVKSGDPATLVSAMRQALQYKPVAVSFSGTPYAVWSSVVPSYQAAGVPIVPISVGPQPLNDTVIANLNSPEDQARQAGMVADWLALNAPDNAKILLFGVPDFPIFSAWPDAVKAQLAKNCAGCTTTTVNATIAQAANPGTINGLIVSALAKDPSIKYVATVDGALNAGLPSAISGAGLSGITIVGSNAGIENMTNVKAGTETAFTGQSLAYAGWAAVDVIARHLLGMDVPDGDGGQPAQLKTRENVGTPSEDVMHDIDYASVFKKLWLVA